MKVEIDVDELSRNEIAGLKKEVNKLLRRIERLERENRELKQNRKEVNDALSMIKSFAEDLPRDYY